MIGYLTDWLVGEALPLALKSPFGETVPDVGLPTRPLVFARQTYVWSVVVRGLLPVSEETRRSAVAHVGAGVRAMLETCGDVTTYDAAHFMLACSSVMHVGSGRCERMARELTARIYRDVAPKDQNSCMHVVEALIELSYLDPWFDGPLSWWLERASSFVRGGSVVERLDEGQLMVEAGHQFEWSWLLSRLGDRAFVDGRGVYDRACRLAGSGNMICNRQNLIGFVVDAGYRLWPHLEAYRAHLRYGESGKAWHALVALRTMFLNKDGTWQERLDESQRPVSQVASPASSLYHLVNAALEETRH